VRIFVSDSDNNPVAKFEPGTNISQIRSFFFVKGMFVSEKRGGSGEEIGQRGLEGEVYV
jgi:hypothetical protein